MQYCKRNVLHSADTKELPLFEFITRGNKFKLRGPLLFSNHKLFRHFWLIRANTHSLTAGEREGPLTLFFNDEVELRRTLQCPSNINFQNTCKHSGTRAGLRPNKLLLKFWLAGLFEQSWARCWERIYRSQSVVSPHQVVGKRSDDAAWVCWSPGPDFLVVSQCSYAYRLAEACKFVKRFCIFFF